MVDVLIMAVLGALGLVLLALWQQARVLRRTHPVVPGPCRSAGRVRRTPALVGALVVAAGAALALTAPWAGDRAGGGAQARADHRGAGGTQAPGAPEGTGSPERADHRATAGTEGAVDDGGHDGADRTGTHGGDAAGTPPALDGVGTPAPRAPRPTDRAARPAAPEATATATATATAGNGGHPGTTGTTTSGGAAPTGGGSGAGSGSNGSGDPGRPTERPGGTPTGTAGGTGPGSGGAGGSDGGPGSTGGTVPSPGPSPSPSTPAPPRTGVTPPPAHCLTGALPPLLDLRVCLFR